MVTEGKTGFAYHPAYMNHDTGPRHPERADRVRVALRALQRSSFWETLHSIHPTAATVEQICYAHSNNYVHHVQRCCEQSVNLDHDTPVVPDTFNAACLSTGGVLKIAEAVMKKKISNGFALVRPPGHHATPSRSMGFCLFNHVAIAARYLQREYGIGKIAIVDWDVHHGNGTQDIFYADPSVFFFSIHQSPLYPGTGDHNETGCGEAVGTTLNIPIPAGSDDEDYIKVLKNTLKPSLIDFSPDFIIISAGFDAHHLDPLATINLTAAGFADLTDIVVEIARETAGGKIVSVLEGGYSLRGLSESVVAHVERLTKNNSND